MHLIHIRRVKRVRNSETFEIYFVKRLSLLLCVKPHRQSIPAAYRYCCLSCRWLLLHIRWVYCYVATSTGTELRTWTLMMIDLNRRPRMILNAISFSMRLWEWKVKATLDLCSVWRFIDGRSRRWWFVTCIAYSNSKLSWVCACGNVNFSFGDNSCSLFLFRFSSGLASAQLFQQ